MFGRVGSVSVPFQFAIDPPQEEDRIHRKRTRVRGAQHALDVMRQAVNIRCLSAHDAPAHRERSPAMMMHHDMGPMPPNALAQETVDSVRRALLRYVQSPASEPGTELRTALHTLAREAKSKTIATERLLITLKDIWQSLPDVQNARDHTEQMRVMHRVVTLCI